ncbi:MAG: ATP-binding protein [Thermodesulfobacteriota bacterium]
MRDEDRSKEELIKEVRLLRRLLAWSDNRTEDGQPAAGDQVKTLEAWQNQALFLQTLIDTIPGPLFYKDAKGRYQGCNAAFETFLGLSRDQIIGRTVFDVSPRELAEKYYEMDRALFENPGVQTYEFSVRYGDGSYHDVIFYKTTFTNRRGEVAGILGVMLDITERRRAEESLRQAHDDLDRRVVERTRELAEAIREMQSEMAQRAKAEKALIHGAEDLKRFAYSIVHDLKSPTIGLYGLTGNLKKHYGHLLDERGRHYCDQLLRTSEHVAALVEKINTYIASKEAPLKIETLNVREVLEIVREEFSSQLSLRQVAWRAPEELPEVRADRLSLLRVFRNLVDNALKYGGESLTDIQIGYEGSDQFHTFAVQDNGRGLAEEDAERLFGLFERDSRFADIPGSGLGLAIAREIAERHGGLMWVRAGPDNKTSFYISIAKDL